MSIFVVQQLKYWSLQIHKVFVPLPLACISSKHPCHPKPPGASRRHPREHRDIYHEKVVFSFTFLVPCTPHPKLSGAIWMRPEGKREVVIGA